MPRIPYTMKARVLDTEFFLWKELCKTETFLEELKEDSNKNDVLIELYEERQENDRVAWGAVYDIIIQHYGYDKGCKEMNEFRKVLLE